jgi:cellulose synthase/poly-beta-1,6-N-acetylglucosamine synthase-like glycosyltransferase
MGRRFYTCWGFRLSRLPLPSAKGVFVILEHLEALVSAASEPRVARPEPGGSLVSVLVPLYNEEEFVATILARVMAAPLPAGMDREIIVVDDASTDSSAAVVDEMAREYPIVSRIVSRLRRRSTSLRDLLECSSAGRTRDRAVSSRQ